MSFERDATVSAYLAAHKMGLPGCKTELDTYISLAKDLQRQLQSYQESAALAVAQVANRRNEFVENFFKTRDEQPSNKYQLVLSEDEHYYLSCIVGHLVPAGKISKSLLDKVSLDELDCEDFDLVRFKGDEVGGYSITINEENV